MSPARPSPVHAPPGRPPRPSRPSGRVPPRCPAASPRRCLAPPPAPIDVPRHLGPGSSGRSSGLVATVALTARLVGLTRANDLFIDELTYSNLASMLAAGRLPALFGRPFFLHPPGGMLLDGAVIRLFDLRGTPMDLVFDLRWAHAALGVVLVVLGHLVVRHVTTRTVAVVAALVLALDPFVLRNDSG